MVIEEDLKNFFKKIDSTNYVIMRNFDNILKDINNGGDIDILIPNKEDFIRNSDAKALNDDKDCFNYKVTIGDHEIPIDVRIIGDNYYDEKWERNMIKQRIKRDFFYCLDEQNFKYSVLYHCLFHKDDIPQKYVAFLVDNFGDDMRKSNLMMILRRYLKSAGYTVSRPTDQGVFFNKRNYRMYFWWNITHR